MVKDLLFSFENTRKISLTELENQTRKTQLLTKVYYEQYLHHNIMNSETDEQTSDKIVVEENTSFAAAKKYLSHDYKTAVLNFANPENPGGGVLNGAMAQEECLCRSSNLYEALIDESVYNDYYLYHRELHSSLYSDRIIYTPSVTVFKDDDEIPKLLPRNEWFNVDIITCAAPYLGGIKQPNITVLKATFKSRIKNIFEVAIDNEIKCIILGAFGCGAFKNPPRIVAEAFKEVIFENNFLKYFKKIIFAIKVDDKTNNKNYIEFCKRFNVYYNKKQFSILGDSISTLQGYNPRGYNVFFEGEKCIASYVRLPQDTWWQKVIDYFGGELLVNNSWSGSRVTQVYKDSLFPSGCSDERTNGLHLGDTKPDIIIVKLGGNDWANGVELEPKYYNGLGGLENIAPNSCNSSEKYFITAYKKMLKLLKHNYPNAEIWCCTMGTTFMSNNPSFSFPYTFGGKHIEIFNDAIRKIASESGCKLIDLFRCKKSYDTIDGSHPNADGMNTLATLVINEMIAENSSLAFEKRYPIYAEEIRKRAEEENKRAEEARKAKEIFCCNIIVSNKSKYCPQCGKKIKKYNEVTHDFRPEETMWLCKCGNAEEFKYKYCSICGKKRK